MSFENWNRFVQEQLSGKHAAKNKQQQNDNLCTTHRKRSKKKSVDKDNMTDSASMQEQDHK